VFIFMLMLIMSLPIYVSLPMPISVLILMVMFMSHEHEHKYVNRHICTFIYSLLDSINGETNTVCRLKHEGGGVDILLEDRASVQYCSLG
jgi:hypothetical protein